MTAGSKTLCPWCECSVWVIWEHLANQHPGRLVVDKADRRRLTEEVLSEVGVSLTQTN